MQLHFLALSKKVSLIICGGSYHEIKAHSPEAKEVDSATRMLVRLVILHQHERLTDNQWQAILALQSHKALIEQSQESDWAEMNADIRLVKEVTGDDMSESDLEDLYWRVNMKLPKSHMVIFWWADAVTF